MPQPDLTEALQALVRCYGIRSVLHGLADIQAEAAPSPSSAPASPKRRRNAGSRLSAVDYVGRMPLPRDKAEALKRAARRFEDKEFLPGIADIREFGRVHGVDPGSRSVSRASSIPRVCTFLAAMDTASVTRMLDGGAFSDPARLGPIADAIRNRAAARRRTDGPDDARAVSGAMTADDPTGRQGPVACGGPEKQPAETGE